MGKTWTRERQAAFLPPGICTVLEQVHTHVARVRVAGGTDGCAATADGGDMLRWRAAGVEMAPIMVWRRTRYGKLEKRAKMGTVLSPLLTDRKSTRLNSSHRCSSY